MAAKKKTAAKTRKPRSDAKHLVLVGVRLTLDQNAALLAAARARAEADGRAVADKSAIVREALELHPDVKRHGR